MALYQIRVFEHRTKTKENNKTGEKENIGEED